MHQANHSLVLISKYLIAGVLGVCIAGGAWAQSHSTHQHPFGNAEKWSRVFDDPARDAWQKPDEVIRALKLAPDALVADVGAGTGYFAARLAKAVPAGRVYAADAEPDMVKFLGERARREGLSNLTAIPAAANGPGLPSAVDLVLLVDVYHHLSARSEYFSRLRSSLKPGGRVAIVDFSLDSPAGPPRSERIAPERVKAEMLAAGYRTVEEFAFLPRQYFLVFAPDKR